LQESGIICKLKYVKRKCQSLPKGKTAHDLTDAQRTVLMTLVECDQAWTINANMAGILYAAGLPQWREELRAFLEEREIMERGVQA
jgi:hypothetical protein